MRILVISELDDLLFGPPVETYPYMKIFEEARYDPFVACHTSGSTGFPKLITPTHGTMAACDAFQNFPAKGYPPTFVEAMKNKRVLAGVPPFHGAGICLRLAMPVYYDCTAVEGPLVPLTADVVNEVHKHGNVSISILRPATWEGIAETPEYLDQLSSLEYAMNVACVLPKDLGDKIATKTPLMSFMGATEAMILPVEYPDKEDDNDWQYWAFSECMGAEFRHFHEDLYEMVMVRNPKYRDYQAVFFTFPDKHEYPMKDLYSPHPTTPGRWIYRGRVDDVIVLMDGKKMHPTTMESIISSHPRIRSAMVFGQARQKPALLLEAADSSAAANKDDRERLLDCVWPTVERANRRYGDAFAIERYHVLFTGVGKPMVKTGKGTVQRIDTIVQYEDEINSLYEAVSRAGESV